MGIGSAIIKDAKKFLDKAAMVQVEAFKQPSFGKGDAGTLHGERSDANGYRFLRITLFGTPNIKCVKGCTLIFEGASGNITCASDTKDIESVYSETIGKGITTFEIYLDDELFQSLKTPINGVRMTFPRKLFGKDSFSFQVESAAFSKFLR